MVANAQARAEQLKDLAATAVAPNAQHVFSLLLAENNEVQNALAQVTAGAKVDSVVQELQNRLGFSDARKEMIRGAMVAAASMAVGGKAGRGSAGGAKGIPPIPDSGASSAANAARLKMQMVAEQAAGAKAPTQITSYSNHALEQFAGRDSGIGVSQSALSGAWSSPLKIEYVPSKYGPTFRYTGTDAVIVVNAEGKVVTGWGKSAAGTGK